MKVAIVGTTANMSENIELDMRKMITLTLKQYDKGETLIISGGAKGVDKMAVEIAKGLGFQTKEYLPEVHDWIPKGRNIGKIGYKKRNLQMAEACDKILCFTISAQNKDDKCYHHNPKQDHKKTAGCWTVNKVIEMKKPFELWVIR
jgi:hypothetical protein